MKQRRLKKGPKFGSVKIKKNTGGLIPMLLRNRNDFAFFQKWKVPADYVDMSKLRMIEPRSYEDDLVIAASLSIMASQKKSKGSGPASPSAQQTEFRVGLPEPNTTHGQFLKMWHESGDLILHPIKCNGPGVTQLEGKQVVISKNFQVGGQDYDISLPVDNLPDRYYGGIDPIPTDISPVLQNYIDALRKQDEFIMGIPADRQGKEKKEVPPQKPKLIFGDFEELE